MIGHFYTIISSQLFQSDQSVCIRLQIVRRMMFSQEIYIVQESVERAAS